MRGYSLTEAGDAVKFPLKHYKVNINSLFHVKLIVVLYMMAQELHVLNCGFDSFLTAFFYLVDSLPPSRRRSLFTLSTTMIIFSSRAYNVLPLIPICKQMINDRAVCKNKFEPSFYSSAFLLIMLVQLPKQYCTE